MSADDETWPLVASVLADNWDFPVDRQERLTGGRNASAWRVSGPAGVAVAKLVEPGDASPAQFEGSLRVAAALDRPDLPTGAPLPSRDGRLAVAVGAGRLGLLRWLDGRPLSGTSGADLERMGMVLARLHRRAAAMAAAVPAPDVIPTWPWSLLSLDALGVTPFDPGDGGLVASAASAAIDGGTGPYRIGLVHGDATPEHFLANGRTIGVIDWASVMHAPPGFDLAVLALTAQRAGAGPGDISRLIASYHATARQTGSGPNGATDDAATDDAATDAAGLARMRALRLAAEIVYFTSRLRHPATAVTTADSDISGLVRARMELRTLVKSS